MDLGIANKTAVVCASSKGLGRGCAEALAEAGVSPRGLEIRAAALRSRRAFLVSGAVEAFAVQPSAGPARGRSQLLLRLNRAIADNLFRRALSLARRRQKDGAGSFLAKCCSKSGFVAIDVYFHCKEPTHSDTLWAIGPPPRAGQPPACLYPSTFPIR